MRALNVGAGLYVDEDGEVFPVTTWFGPGGEECDPADAIICVAGKEDRWHVLAIADFDNPVRPS